MLFAKAQWKLKVGHWNGALAVGLGGLLIGLFSNVNLKID
jgi:hypothetical protein